MKFNGMSLNALSNETSSQCERLMVCLGSQVMHHMIVYGVTCMALGCPSRWKIPQRRRRRTTRQVSREGRTFFHAEWKRNDEEKATSAALDKVAKEVDTKHLTAVAICICHAKDAICVADHWRPQLEGRTIF
ncbi:hypothetical protein OG21DRAFT_365458 [Imleria badia]|nr:hypothetical protein OG21DRAFT_365458 [Imleria badia]